MKVPPQQQGGKKGVQDHLEVTEIITFHLLSLLPQFPPTAVLVLQTIKQTKLLLLKLFQTPAMHWIILLVWGCDEFLDTIHHMAVVEEVLRS